MLRNSQTRLTMTVNVAICGLVAVGGLCFGFAGDTNGFGVAVVAAFFGAVFIVYAFTYGIFGNSSRRD